MLLNKLYVISFLRATFLVLALLQELPLTEIKASNGIKINNNNRELYY